MNYAFRNDGTHRLIMGLYASAHFISRITIFRSIQTARIERVRRIHLLSFSCMVAFILYCSLSMKAKAFMPAKDLIAVSYNAVTVRGTVLDKTTNLPIPYADITLTERKFSTQANSKGEFALSLRPENDNESVRVTSLGYIPQEFSTADLLKQGAGTSGIKLFLTPKHERLNIVEVKTKASKWKTKKIGYHIDEGTSFQHEFNPSDTISVEAAGQEIGNRIYIKKRPAFLQSVSFGLAGSGNVRVVIGVRLYSLRDDLPHLNLLPEPVIISVPPHHSGWVTVNLSKYNITLKEDVAVAIEWLTDTNKLTSSSLMAFATVPKGQVTYYRDSDQQPWKILKSTLLNAKSIGMYATLLFER